MTNVMFENRISFFSLAHRSMDMSVNIHPNAIFLFGFFIFSFYFYFWNCRHFFMYLNLWSFAVNVIVLLFLLENKIKNLQCSQFTFSIQLCMVKCFPIFQRFCCEFYFVSFVARFIQTLQLSDVVFVYLRSLTISCHLFL